MKSKIKHSKYKENKVSFILKRMAVVLYLLICITGLCSCGKISAENNKTAPLAVQKALSSAEHEPGQYQKIADGEQNSKQSLIEPQENKNAEIGKEDNKDGIKRVTPQGDADDNNEQKEKYRVVIDPGHGGVFSGAEYNGRIEKNYTLELAGYVSQYLKEYNEIEVLQTRDTDIQLSADIVEDLELRAEYAKENNADILVSLHFNALDNHSGRGCTAYISKQGVVNEASKKLSDLILKNIEAMGFSNNGTLTRNSNDMVDENGEPLDYYAINRHSANRKIPGIIIEHCFIDSDEDMKMLDSEEKLRILAKADAEGIAEYFGIR